MTFGDPFPPPTISTVRNESKYKVLLETKIVSKASDKRNLWNDCINMWLDIIIIDSLKSSILHVNEPMNMSQVKLGLLQQKKTDYVII